MTREEAIDLLDNLIGMIEDNHNSDYDTAFQMAIKALEQEPNWIPVSERLPKKDESVLLTICANSSLYGFNENFVKVMCGSYSPCEDKRDWIVNEIRYYIDNVIAWMPLPPCYEPQEISDRNMKMWQEIFKEESDHKCHTCKHYTSGEHDGSCGSYICKEYSNWESEDKE